MMALNDTFNYHLDDLTKSIMSINSLQEDKQDNGLKSMANEQAYRDFSDRI